MCYGQYANLDLLEVYGFALVSQKSPFPSPFPPSLDNISIDTRRDASRDKGKEPPGGRADQNRRGRCGGGGVGRAARDPLRVRRRLPLVGSARGASHWCPRSESHGPGSPDRRQRRCALARRRSRRDHIPRRGRRRGMRILGTRHADLRGKEGGGGRGGGWRGAEPRGRVATRPGARASGCRTLLPPISRRPRRAPGTVRRPHVLIREIAPARGGGGWGANRVRLGG